MGTNVSVLLTVRNVDKYISYCISALLNQTYNDFEIIIIDDVSSDNTKKMIEKFTDNRIRYIRNTEWFGLSKSRNKCLELANGDYLFFTDGDCAVSKNWISEGLKYLKNTDNVGIEGKTYYVSKEYKSTRSDDVVENKKGGLFMTCNIAYKKQVLKIIGGFDEKFTFHEDRDLAFRALKQGKIVFNPEMIVYHQRKTFTPKQFLKNGKIIRNRVLLYKKFKDKPSVIWRIVNPTELVSIFFPLLIFTSFFKNSYKSKDDFNLFPFIYVRLIYERLQLWEMCAKERIFLI
ncbi:MAG TPA: glycosyltransferase [Paludibacter sp.]|nr:glycosyltransferase [Paludibacter sp.]